MAQLTRQLQCRITHNANERRVMPRRSARLTVRTATVDLAAGAAQADVEDALQAAQDPAPPSVDPLSGASPAHEASAATEAPDEDAAALAAAEDAAAAAAASAVTAAAVAAAAEASAAREAALSAEVLAREVERRRNFAIISHPDAGKTTLTERLLLYGGAIHEAGEVKARASKRHATSDWMELERSRGISITSTAMTFAYSTFQLNLLDTPGHSDFSEDTYRTLAAADNAVMLVDAAKGIEPQTRKLFEVARMRGLPIFTFVNKLDRPALNGFEIIEQLEREFGLSAYPITWPIGSGDRFCGLYHRPSHSVHLYIKNTKGKAAECRVVPFDDAALPGLVDPELWAQLQEDVELMQVLSDELSPDDVVNGRVTPMFFGSAFQTIGVDLFLAEFVKWAARPAAARATGNAAALAPHAAGGGAVAAAAAAVGAAARAGAVPPPASSSPASSKGGGGGGSGSGGGGGGGGGGSTGSAASEGLVLPTSPHFSGIVFKLQANMDPKHRDKVAFVRVVSGKFEKGMKVKVARSGRVVSLSRPQTMFARDRSTVQEGFAGDVIGLTNPGAFAIGDTLYAGPEVAFPPIPSFSPELFAYLRCAPNQRKAFTKGVAGLLGEGAVQVLYSRDEYVVDPILAAVGQLQFEVVQYRMKDEYGVDTTLEPLSYSLARWVVGGWACVEAAGRLFNTQVTKDMWGRPVLLFRNEYSFNAVLGDAGEALGELSPYALPPSI